MNKFKKAISLITSFAMLGAFPEFISFAEESVLETVAVPQASEEFSIDGDGANGYDIQAALDKAKDNKENEYTKIVLTSGKTYTIYVPLYIYSNTIIEAEGAVLEKSYDITASPTLLVNRAADGNTEETGGYDVTKNIYINGGTWSGGDLSKASSASTNICIVHAENVYIQNAQFSGAYNGHMMELNAVKNALVQNCSFDDVLSDSTVTPMALQIDLAHDCKGKYKSAYEHNQCEDHSSLPAGYLADDTVCKNIRIIKNSFNTKESQHRKFSTTVGSDKTLTVKIDGKFGIYHEDIKICYNEIQGTSDAAIASRGHKNAVIENNTIKNSDGKGIAVKKCLGASIKYNTITDCKEQGILIYADGDYDSVKSTAGDISDNIITNSSHQGISLADGSKAENIKNNTINKTAKNGIAVYEKSSVTSNVSSNKISNTSEKGIFVSDSSINSISSNTINDSAAQGISIMNSTVKSVKSNTVNRSAGHSIMLNSSKSDSIESNAISDSKSRGIFIYNSSVVGSVIKNTVKNCLDTGIFISVASNAGSVSNNKIEKNSAVGIGLSDASASGIYNNTVLGCQKYGIGLMGTSSVGKIYGNILSQNSKDIHISKTSKAESVNQKEYVTKAATIAVKSVSVKIKKATVGVKEKISLDASVSPSNATNKNLTYKSSDTKILTVNSKGVVTAKKKGKAKITVTAKSGASAVINITVKKAPKSVKFSKKSLSLKKGKSKKLKIKLSKGAASYNLKFKSNKTKVVKVDSNGKIKALKKGIAKITVSTFNNKKAVVTVKVK